MSIETIPGTKLRYYLISYDKDGKERTDNPRGRMSDVIREELRSDGGYTDVLFVSHGWKGDVPAAKDQYNRWLAAWGSCADDLQQVREKVPGFKPLLVGLHWPSLPFGEEDHGAGAVSFAAPGAAVSAVDELVESGAERIADTPAARDALRTIIEAARANPAPASLSQDLAEAFRVLNREAGLEEGGVADAPDGDRESFDPESYYQKAKEEDVASFGGGGRSSPLLSVVQQLSFWKMKQRALKFGESGGRELLATVQSAGGGKLRCHLVGHSFGCIVCSAIAHGQNGARPIDSMTLIQGALSLWSYCDDIPKAPGKPGYFNPLVRKGRVRGPVVATLSEYDKAVGNLYPVAAGAARQVDFAPGDLPKYGALGTFGFRGPGIKIEDLEMRPLSKAYGFQHGKFYNLKSGRFICEGNGVSGAHSDIAKPEVGHAVWGAILGSLNGS